MKEKKPLQENSHGKIKHRAGALILILFVVWGIYWGMNSSFMEGEKTENKGKTAPPFKISEVKIEELSQTMEVPGQIIFREKANISSKVSGRIEKIFLREGDPVKKGQVIAKMERLNLEISLKNQESELDIARRGLQLSRAKYSNALKAVEIKLKTIQKARADLKDKKMTWKNMKRTYENKKALHKVGGVSKTELGNIKTKYMTLYTSYELAKADYAIQQVGYRTVDIKNAGYKVPGSIKGRIALFKKLNTKIELAEVQAAKARVRQSKNSLLSTREMLKECTIRSPIDGVLASRQMGEGEMVTGESVIATVIDVKRVYLSMNLNERDITKVKKNQRVDFTVDALGEKKFSSKVSRIIPLLDMKSRTIEVRALVNNSDRNLLPGMFARAVLSTGKKIRGIVIPESSVLKRKGGIHEVYLIKNGIVMRERIVLGRKIQGNYEVKEGLKAKDRIVTSGIRSVYEGMKIKGDV